jgi:hypothetical protein
MEEVDDLPDRPTATRATIARDRRLTVFAFGPNDWHEEIYPPFGPGAQLPAAPGGLEAGLLLSPNLAHHDRRTRLAALLVVAARSWPGPLAFIGEAADGCTGSYAFHR